MGLSRTISQINGDFDRKSQFSPLSVFNGSVAGVGRRNFVTAVWIEKKNRMMALPGEKSMTKMKMKWTAIKVTLSQTNCCRGTVQPRK